MDTKVKDSILPEEKICHRSFSNPNGAMLCKLDYCPMWTGLRCGDEVMVACLEILVDIADSVAKYKI
jgi:hypothetical protein